MRWFRRLIVVFLVGLLGLYPLLAPVPHRIDKTHCELIKPGMTKDEVESIFGVPAGDYDFAEQKPLALYTKLRKIALRLRSMSSVDVSVTEQSLSLTRQTEWIGRVDWQTWTSRHGSFSVSLGEDTRVVSTSGPWEVRIVSPWQRWWKKLTGN